MKWTGLVSFNEHVFYLLASEYCSLDNCPPKDPALRGVSPACDTVGAAVAS